MGTPPAAASKSRVRPSSIEAAHSIESSVVKMRCPAHLSVALPIVLHQLLASSSHARPQTVHEVVPDDRESRVFVPNCDSVLRRSQPECQQQATVYGSPGQVWGELTVDVSSPVLFITKPKDLIQKRKNKNKEKEKQEGLLV